MKTCEAKKEPIWTRLLRAELERAIAINRELQWESQEESFDLTSDLLYRPECCQACIVKVEPLPGALTWRVVHRGIGDAVKVFSDRVVTGGEPDGVISSWLRGVHEYEQQGLRLLANGY